jgi:hypothetical protein
VTKTDGRKGEYAPMMADNDKEPKVDTRRDFDGMIVVEDELMGYWLPRGVAAKDIGVGK